MSTPVTITVDQEARTLSLSRSLDVGGAYLVTVALTADKTPLLSSGSAYALTLKPQGRPSGTAYGTWPLTYVSTTSATASVDLALESLYTAIADRDSLPCILGIDEVGGGPLAYTTEQRLVRIGNQARRPDDVADPAVGTPISAEEVTAALAGLEGLALSNADPQALADAADPGDDTAAARGNHVHPLPSASDVGAVPASHVTTHPAPTDRDTRNEAAQTAASQAEAEAGTETAVRSWSPLRIWQGVAGKLLSILTTAGTVLYRSSSGLAALTLRTTVRAAGTADDTSLATEAAVRTLHGTHNLAATAAPTADDDSTAGYHVGSQWIDTTADNAYVCMDAAEGAAVWEQINGSGSGTIGGSTGSVDNAVLRADGTGGATLHASNLAIADYESGTQGNVGLSVIHDSESNVALRLAPKGTGPLYLGPPADGTATGGNTRGPRSVDFQNERGAASQVAAGADSFLFPGANSTANPGIAGGYQATVTNGGTAIGYGPTCSGRYGAVSVGNYTNASGESSAAFCNAGTAYLNGQFAIGGRKEGASGTAQTSVIQKGVTVATADATNLAGFVLRNNTTWDCEISIVGRQSGGASAVLRRRVCIQRTGTTTALIGAVESVGTDVFSAALSGTTVAVTADDTNEALDVHVTQVDATSTKWLVSILAREVTY